MDTVFNKFFLRQSRGQFCSECFFRYLLRFQDSTLRHLCNFFDKKCNNLKFWQKLKVLVSQSLLWKYFGISNPKNSKSFFKTFKQHSHFNSCVLTSPGESKKEMYSVVSTDPYDECTLCETRLLSERSSWFSYYLLPV